MLSLRTGIIGKIIGFSFLLILECTTTVYSQVPKLISVHTGINHMLECIRGQPGQGMSNYGLDEPLLNARKDSK
jgi:hypothetical protein